MKSGQVVGAKTGSGIMKLPALFLSKRQVDSQPQVSFAPAATTQTDRSQRSSGLR